VLYDIVVDPVHRGQGVGRMLLDATLAALKTKGAPRVVLSRRQSGTNPRSACSLARDSGER